MARIKRQHVVLEITTTGFKVASEGAGLQSFKDCTQWVQKHGEKDARYQRVAFLGEPLMVAIDMVEKRKVHSAESWLGGAPDSAVITADLAPDDFAIDKEGGKPVE